MAMPIWRRLLAHVVCCAFARALANTGKSRPARIAITAMTTSSSINVNPRQHEPRPPRRNGRGRPMGGLPVSRQGRHTARPAAKDLPGILPQTAADSHSQSRLFPLCRIEVVDPHRLPDAFHGLRRLFAAAPRAGAQELLDER